jgi:16S rRNA (guanine966-N2)-methyltransferase
MSTGNKAEQRCGRRGTLRIIGGQWRGRKLTFPAVAGLRPTGDRLRETLFNWLAPLIVDAHCLDLFAGSGALGLEAVSRGAASALLLEQSRDACDALQQHCKTLGAENRIQVLHADSLRWLQQTQARAFDLVFLDPPFDSSMLQASIEQLAGSPWLAPEARIYIETHRQQLPSCPANWSLLRSLEAGEVVCRLYRFNDKQ